MSSPSLGKFDVEDGVKLVAIIAISDFRVLDTILGRTNLDNY